MAALEGKVVVVTAGAWGLGRELSVALARAGARVVVGDGDVWSCRETVRLAQEAGGSCRFVPTNVFVEAHHERLVRVALADAGRIDAVVCNVDLGHGAPARLEDFGAYEWRHQAGGIAAHPFLAARAALQALSASRGSLVVTGRLLEESSRQYLAAAAAQASVVELVRRLAHDHAGRLRAFAVRPGDLSSFRAAPRAAEAISLSSPADVGRAVVDLVGERLRLRPGAMLELA